MTRALSGVACARLSASLHEANNDTGRVAFCGPIVVSAITGFSVSKVEAEVQAFRKVDAGPDRGGRKGIVRGTYPEEVAAALAHFGYSMELKEGYMHLPRKERPSLWGNWMQRQRNPWVHYILALHVGKQGHWVVIKGVKVCDTYSDGMWQFVCDWPHKSKRIMEVYEVRRALGG
ncbi:MAG TPA: hypothetical protein VFY92_03215 [Hyphomicrobiaceae bacterium]|nr:hypothetical protein [Hyphomicrobiaceae bacterium]